MEFTSPGAASEQEIPGVDGGLVDSGQRDVVGADRDLGIGADQFLFAAAGTAHDTIVDFDSANASAGHDLINLSGRGLSFGSLTITQVGADTKIAVGADDVTLTGINAATIDTGDFVF